MFSFVPARSDSRLPSSLGRLAFWVVAAAWFVLAIGWLALRYWIWPHLDEWRPRIEAAVTEAVGRPVRLGALHTGFAGLRPVLIVDDVRLDDDSGQPVLEVGRATAELSLRTLLTGEPRLALLRLERPRLTVERGADGVLKVAGFAVDRSGAEGRGLDTLLRQRRVLVEGATLVWHDRTRSLDRELAGIDLSIGSVGRRHRIAARMAGARGLADSVRFAGEFYRAARSRPSAFESWSGEGFAQASAFDVAGLQALLGIELPVERARADFMAWARIDRGRLGDALLKAAGDSLRLRADALPISLERYAVEVDARPAERNGYELRFARLQLVEPGGFTLEGVGEQRLALDDRLQPRSGRVKLAPFDAARALAFARTLPWPSATGDVLRRLSATGSIDALSLAFTQSAQLEFDGDVDFDALAVRLAPSGSAPARSDGRPLPRVPWFANLSGHARVTQDRGEIRLQGKRATLGFPGVFENEAVPLDSLEAQATWTVGGGGDEPALRVDVESLRFANADAAGSVSGSYVTAAGGPGAVDLTGKLERADARRTVRYLPLQIAPEVRSWVGRSITAGSSRDVDFRLRGNLLDFPFRDPARGEFLIVAEVTDGALAYAPGWPAIDRFQGTLRFERVGMDINMRSGRIYGVALGDAHARIADFGQAVLLVDGSGQGPAQDMLRYVNASPLGQHIDDFTQQSVASGDARLALKLALPLADLDAAQVAGTVTFAGNEIRLDPSIPPFSAVDGRLEFTEKSLALRGIRATFLGGPLQVEGETGDAGRFALRARGTMSADSMRTVVDNPLTRKLSGAADYRAQVDVRQHAATVVIESDLVGLASALPEPFAKPAEAKWPLRVVAEPVDQREGATQPTRDTIAVALRENFRLLFERTRAPGGSKMLIQRGAFAINAEPVLPDSGFAVALRTATVDFDQWGGLLSATQSQDAGTGPAGDFAEGFTLLPSIVSVVADHVTVGNKGLHDVVFGASRVGGFWRANILAREVNGFFNWRAAAPGQRIGTLTARFARLEIPAAREREVESLLESSPEELPALDIAAEEFVLGEHRLGSLRLVASNAGAGDRPLWTLSELRIGHPAGTLSATGTWAPPVSGAARATRLDFDLAVKDAGALLATFGFKDVLRGGAGKLEGSIGWDGSPLAIDYPSLAGDLKIQMGKGQFLKTEPGIAKLIGVVNLQSLPRRLTLDFRDVIAEGFAFDAINGVVDVDRGVARTRDLAMRGVQAQVHIRGEADLASETQSLQVEVQPELNAGLASLAYAAVNPALGLGSFVAQLMLRKPLQQLFTYEYEVKGSWADPQVAEKRRYAQTVAPFTP